MGNFSGRHKSTNRLYNILHNMYSLILWALFVAAPFSVFAETSLCSDGEYECANGACVSVDAKCNGTSDCPDASDETHALCHNHYCPPNAFRCAYGGCVDGSAPCDDRAECFDNSDERLLRCRNATAVIDGEFKCENGDKIPVYQLCDGEKNCADGTDESVSACAGRRCGKSQFQCKYGACVPARAKCDMDIHRDCADGSDEDDVLCNRPQSVIPNRSITPKNRCVLPENPEYGTYSVSGRPDARPGMTFDNVTMVVSCESRMRPTGPVEMHCSDGKWSMDKFSSCWYFCEVPRHPSVTYYCGGRYNVKCDDFVISDTSVYPKCNDFYRTTGGQMLHMSCIYGNWNFVETCDLDFRVSKNGNNITVRLGEKLVLRLSGSEYSVAVDINSENIIHQTVPEPKPELRDIDYIDYAD